nr:dipeptide/oligopeptide/nickel ABC transporter ATP-binding protein [Chlamydiales bacterium]
MKKLPLVEFKNVFVSYKKNIALKNCTFSIYPKEIFAIIGKSGSGKSTIAKLLSQLQSPASGEILYEGKNLHFRNRKESLNIKKSIQMVFQDPVSSLNPQKKISEILKEPFIIHRLYKTKKDLQSKIEELIESVFLPISFLNKYPFEISGGECQRIAIARAIATNPKILICDEATSSLDPITEQEIMKLLLKLKKQLNLTILIISHNLEIIEKFAD